jgi:hypothetical protein
MSLAANDRFGAPLALHVPVARTAMIEDRTDIACQDLASFRRRHPVNRELLAPC